MTVVLCAANNTAIHTIVACAAVELRDTKAVVKIGPPRSILINRRHIVDPVQSTVVAKINRFLA